MRYKVLAYLSLLLSFSLVSAAILGFYDFMFKTLLFMILLIINAINSAAIIAVVEIKFKDKWSPYWFFSIQAFLITISILILIIA